MKSFQKLLLPVALLAIGYSTVDVAAQTAPARITYASQRTNQCIDFTKAAESTINGVVSIKSFATVRSTGYPGGFNDPFFEFFFGDGSGSQGQQRKRRGGNSDGSNGSDPDNMQEKGLGSGVIISADGYIITNNHVIDGAERLEVTLNDNRMFSATVIGTDPVTDLALIKISATGLPVIKMGDSDDLKIGEWVLAVGNPFGLTSTVTAGIVSAKARSLSGPQNGGRMSIESYIQTDAAVNPGNSGGALVNLDGELVGINTAIYSQTGSYAGYSFAIPTSIVKKIAEDLRTYKTVQRAVLGISFSELTPKVAKERGITKVTEGLIVGKVQERSAAMEAGIQVGDIIIAIDGQPTHNSSQLMELMNRHRPGDKIKITYVRDNKEHTVETQLYNNSGSTTLSTITSVADLGCAFRNVSDDLKESLKITSGMQVVGLKNGPMKNAGVKEGFIVRAANDVPVRSLDDIESVYNAAASDNSTEHVIFLSGIYPNGKKGYYAVELD